MIFKPNKKQNTMLFNLNSKTATELLIEKSNSILNVFKQTAEDLISVNNEIQQENNLLEIERSEIEAKQRQLAIAKEQNERVAEKINKFLQD